MPTASSTQVHRPHPERLAGSSLLHPHSRGFPGGLQSSGFVATQAGGLKGYFDEPGLTTRCTVILSGACSMHANGQTHHFQTHDLVLARTAAEFFTFENSAGFSALEIHVPPRLLEQMQLIAPDGIVSRAIQPQDPALKTARHLLSYLRTNTHTPMPPACPQALVGYGLAITLLGYAFTHGTPARATPHKHRGLEAAKRALLAQFDQSPSLTELAAISGLSLTQFKTLFRQHYGCAPYTLFQTHRMEYARTLLRTKNVTETAMELGYSNISHFSAAFQRQFGCAPSQWQRLIYAAPA